MKWLLTSRLLGITACFRFVVTQYSASGTAHAQTHAESAQPGCASGLRNA
jgi:hypothetical protein